MKTLFTIDCRPRGGGAPISTGNLIESLVKSNTEIQVGLLMPDCEEKYSFENSLDIFRLSKFKNSFPYMFLKPIQWLKLAYYVRIIIKTYNPDIIHCQMPKVAMAVSVLKKIRLIDKNIILIYTDREHFATLKKKHRLVYKCLIGKEYDAVICLSQINAEFWKKVVPTVQTEVIPNSAGRSYECSEIKSNISKQEKTLNILFAGRMDPVKNWELALEIISLTANQGIHCSVILSCKTSEKDQCEIYEIAAKETGADVTFYYNLKESEMISMFDKADIFVITSFSESFGRTIVEAMSRKCIVLGTTGGAIPEVIGDKENILSYNSYDFIRRINYYRDNPNSLKTDKEKCYKRFIENYTIDICGKKTLSLYQELYKSRFNN